MNKRATILITFIMIAGLVIVASGCVNRITALPTENTIEVISSNDTLADSQEIEQTLPYNENDLQNAIDNAWENAISDDDPAYLQEIAKLSSYRIASIEDGNIYTLNMIVAGIDMGGVLDQIGHENSFESEDDMNSYLIEFIRQCPYVETTATIYATPIEEGYSIAFSDTFVDAMSGKIYSYFMSKVAEIMGGSQ